MARARAEHAIALEVGRRLGARWVVSGGYQRLGDQLRITGRLVDVTTSTIVRAAKVDGAIDDLFTLQDRLATELINGTGRDPGRAAARPASRARPTSPPLADAGRATDEGWWPLSPPIRRSAPMPPAAVVAAPPTAPSRVVDGSDPGEDSGIPSTVSTNPLVPPGMIDGPPPPMPPEVMTRDEQGRTTIRAIKLTEGIRLDGRLDEQVYHTVPAITGLIQQVPDEGAPATEKTEAWIMFDERNVYVAGRVWDSAPPSAWVANEMRRDTSQLRQNDTFSVVLRHVLRSAQRRRLLHQSSRGARRLRDHQRRQCEQRLEPGLGPPHRAVRGRLDGRNGKSRSNRSGIGQDRRRSGASSCAAGCGGRTSGCTLRRFRSRPVG